MNKEDLKTGDIIETREGNRYMVIETETKDYEKIAVRTGGYINLSDYNENLAQHVPFFRDLDIMKVYKNNSVPSLSLLSPNDGIKWIWERNEKHNKLIKKISSAITEALNEMLDEED